VVLFGELAASPPVQPLKQRRPMRRHRWVKVAADLLVELA
jgi:hypothetical protein